jgi:INO80 complex subunit Ies4
MGQKKTKIITLKLSSSKLKEFNFPDPVKKKKLISIKAATPVSPAPGLNEDTGTSTPVKSTLGPRLGLGAINAQLRALDRSGKPCRKWTKQAIQLKSFTGFKYTLSGWNGGPKEAKEENQRQKKVKKEGAEDKDGKLEKEHNEDEPATGSAEPSAEVVKVET